VVQLHCAASGDCHEHVLLGLSGAGAGSFSAPDHVDPTSLLIRLIATDPQGLSATAVVRIEPETVALELTSDPPEFLFALDGSMREAPFQVDVIVGSTHSVSAVSPQVHAGTSYEFVAWSDGGDATHLVTVLGGSFGLHATFEPSVSAGADSGSQMPIAAGGTAADAGDVEPAPADAGRADAGRADAGRDSDAGQVGRANDDGCRCSAPGARRGARLHPGWLGALGVLALHALRRRR